MESPCHPGSSKNPAGQAEEQTHVCQPTQDASIIGAQWFVDTGPPTSSLSDVYAGQTSSTTPEEDIVEVKPVLVHSVPEVELFKNPPTTTSLSRNAPEQFHLRFRPHTHLAKDSLLCEQESKIDIRQYATEQPSCVTSEVDQNSALSKLVYSQERDNAHQYNIPEQEILPYQHVQKELPSGHRNPVQETNRDRKKGPLYKGKGKRGRNSLSQLCNADDELESHAVSVIVEEEDVVKLWRTIGNWMELRSDANIARFLISLYFNPDHKGVQSTDRCVHCDQVLSYCCMSCLLSSRQPPSTHLTSHSASDANHKQKQNYATTSSSSQDDNWNSESLQHQDNSDDDMAEDFCNDDESDSETQNEQEGPSNKKQRLDTGVKRTNTTTVVKLTRCDAQSVCVSKQDQSSSRTSTHSRQKTYRRRKRCPSPQETAQEEEERNKYPICDGIHFTRGQLPSKTSFSELRCSKCNKTFAKKQEIIRHMKNPGCDTGDDLFQGKQHDPCVSTPADSDEDWAPPEKEEAEHAEDCATDANDEDVDSTTEKRKSRKQKHHGVKTSKVYTMEEFMSGKVQIPMTTRNKDPRVYYSHYTCAKCCKVFTKLLPYKQHVADHKSDEASDLPPPQGPDPESLKILEDIRDRLVHACSFCDRIFFSVKQRDSHVYSHKYFIGDDGKLNCIFCGEVFIKYIYFACHIRGQKSKNKQKECNKCGFKFLSHCQIQTHMKEHGITNTAVSCQVCETSFESLSKKEITAHLKTHKELQRMCLCTVCGKEVPATQLSKHKLMHSNAPECCKVCKVSFTSLSKKEITAHLKTHKELRRMSLCTVCGKEMPALHLSTHKLIHIRPFKCPFCQKSFRSNAEMEHHKRTHGEKQQQCEECGAKFFHPKQLKNHIEFKHQGKTFDCKYCGRKLARNFTLQQHIKDVHEKLTPFVCKFCGNGFRNKNELKGHERIHTGEKPYQCQYCPSSFGRRDYLNAHIRTHTGEKPYQCEDCVEKFATRTSYTSHRKNHHRDKLYPCDQCSQVMLTKSDLAVHHQRWHATTSNTDVVHTDMKAEAGVSDTSNSSDRVNVAFMPTSLM